MSDKPAEQAYHARGAGLPLKERLGETAWLDELVASAGNRNRLLTVLRAFSANLRSQREPGADTGTTPQGGGRSPNDTSPMYSDDVIAAIRQQKQSTAAERGTTPPPSTAEFEPLLRGELKHGRSCPAVGAPMDEGNCDCGLKWRIRLQTEMTLRNAWEKRAYEAEAALAAAEGLTLYDILNTKAFNGSMHQAKQIADEINAKRAATQRAPVEQGPKAALITDDGRPRLILKCPQCGYNTPKYLNVQGLGCSECNPSRNVLAAAPDHAREGALLKLGAKLDKIISQAALDAKLDLWMRQQVNAALDGLADGKEGGE